MTRPSPAWWWAGAAGLAAVLLLRAWDPAAAEWRICVFRNLLELPCPGCGLSRALSHLARGELAAMFAMHPMAPLVAAQAGAAFFAWGLFGAGWLERQLASRAALVAAANVLPLVALWVGRAATGSLPF